MADMLTEGALWVVQLLLQVLPESFVTDWLAGMGTDLEWVHQGLSALNWLIDINGMLVVMGLWLLCVQSYFVCRFGISGFARLREYLVRLYSIFNVFE